MLDGMEKHEPAVVVTPDSILWVPLRDGAEAGVLSGDPEHSELEYTIRFRTSQEIKVHAHWHAEVEHLTVLQGPFSLGFGKVFDDSLLKPLAAGSYVCVPKQTAHFALYGEGTIVQVNGIGPFKSIYFNPAQDPQRRFRNGSA